MNISRSKFLINKLKKYQLNKKRAIISKCNHCGGAFRNSGDMTACIMCSREQGHICDKCAHEAPETINDNAKSA